MCAEIMLRAASCYGGIFVVCRAEEALRVTDELTVVVLSSLSSLINTKVRF